MSISFEEFNDYMGKKIDESTNNGDRVAAKKINDELLKLNEKRHKASDSLSKATREFDVSTSVKQRKIIADIDNSIETYKKSLADMSNVAVRVNDYLGLCKEIESYYKPVIKESIDDVFKKYDDLCKSIEQLIANCEIKDEIADHLYYANDGNGRYPLNISLDQDMFNKILDNSIGSLRNRLTNMAEMFE